MIRPSMTTLKEKELADKPKNERPLTCMQKLLFGTLCWGVQSWGQAENFKKNGYDQKYLDAKKAMYTGLTVYVWASQFLFCSCCFFEKSI